MASAVADDHGYGAMPDIQPSHSSGSTIADPEADLDMSRPSSPPKAANADPRTTLQHVLAGRSSPPHARRHQEHLPESRDLAPEMHNQTISSADSKQKSPARRTITTTPSSSVYSGNKMKNIKKDDGIPLWRVDIQYDFLRAVFEDKTAVFTNSYENHNGCTFADIYVDAMARSSKTSKILRDKLLSDRAAAANMAMVCLLVNVGRMNTTLNFFPEMRAQLRTYHAIPCLQAQQDSNAYKQLQDAPRLKSILKGASEDKQEPNTLEKIKVLPVPRTNPVHLIFVLSQYAPKLTELHFSPQLDFFDVITRRTLSSRSRAKGFLWLMWWYLESDFSREAAVNNPFGPGQPPELDGVPQKLPPFEHLTEAQALLENVDTKEEYEYGYKKQEERKQIIESDIVPAAPAMRRGKKGTNSVAPSEDGGHSPMRDVPSPLPPRSLRDLTRPKPRKHSTMGSYHSDTDRTRSISPSGHHTMNDARSSLGMRINSVLNDEQGALTPSAHRSARTRSNRDKGERTTAQRPVKSKTDHALDPSSPAPSGSGLPGSTHDAGHHRRSRPLTAHQIAVERNRQQRIEYLLDRRMRRSFARSKKTRNRDGALWRAWARHEAMENPFENSEEDEKYAGTGKETASHHAGSKDRGFGGSITLDAEQDDYGEEVAAYAAAVRRTSRRLDRWEDEQVGDGEHNKEPGQRRPAEGGTEKKKVTVNGVNKRKTVKAEVGGDDTVQGDTLPEQPKRAKRPILSAFVEQKGGDEEEFELDDMDRELLGEVQPDMGEEEEDDDNDEGEVEGEAEEEEEGEEEEDDDDGDEEDDEEEEGDEGGDGEGDEMEVD